MGIDSLSEARNEIVSYLTTHSENIRTGAITISEFTDTSSPTKYLTNAVFKVHDFERYFSCDFIEKYIKDLIQMVETDVMERDDIESAVDKLFSLSDRVVLWTVVGLLANVDVKNMVRVGSCDIRPAAQESLAREMEQLDQEVLTANERSMARKRERFVKELFSHRNTSLIVTEVRSGDFNKAIELSRQHLRQAISILRFYGQLLSPTSDIVGLYGTIHVNRDMVLAIKETDFAMQFRRDVMYKPLELSKTLVRKMEDNGLLLMNRVIAKQIAAELENRLIKAIAWVGDAEEESDVTGKYVKLWVALEILFGKNNPSRRLARTLGNPDSCSVEFWYDRGKGLYELRNEVLHEGRNDVPKESLEQLKKTLNAVILKFAGRNGLLETCEKWSDVAERPEYKKNANILNSYLQRSALCCDRAQGPKRQADCRR